MLEGEEGVGKYVSDHAHHRTRKAQAETASSYALLQREDVLPVPVRLVDAWLSKRGVVQA